MRNRSKSPIIFLLLALSLIPSIAYGQTPVALLPPSHQQFFLPNGQPNAGGCIYFYASGTSAPQATYTDLSGTLQQSNPVILDSSGFATIYIQNLEYTVQMWSTGQTPGGNTDCKTNGGSQIWSQNGVSAFQIITGTQTIIFAGVTSYPAGTAGEVLYRTDLGRLAVFNTSWDVIPTDNSIDTLANKTINIGGNTITCPTNTAGLYLRDNGTQVACAAITASDLPPALQPNTIENSYTIDGSGPVTVNNLVKRTTAAFATVTTPLTTDTGGVVGICVANCTANSAATIAVMSAGITCNFDLTPTVAGDYVTISSSIAGDCHDAGAMYPTGQQVLGRVLNSSSTTMTLFPSEIRGGGGLVALDQNATPVTVTSNNTEQPLMTYTLPANTLSGSQDLNIIARGVIINTSGGTVTYRLRLYLNSNVIVDTGATGVSSGSAPEGWYIKGDYTLVTGGSSGTIECQADVAMPGTGGVFLANFFASPNLSTFSFNTTTTHVIQVTIQMGSAAASESTTQRQLIISRIG